MPDFMSFNEFVDSTAAAKIDFHRETIGAGLRRVAAPLAPGAAPLQAVDSDDLVEEEFDKMKNFLVSRYQGIQNVRLEDTFEGPGENLFDCVEFDQQPTFQAARKAGVDLPADPPKPAPLGDEVPPAANAFNPAVSSPVPPLRRGLNDRFGNAIACEQDRIPLRRITLAEMARLGKFDRYFAKYPAAAPFAGSLGTSEIHHHAVCSVTNGGSYFGCSTWLNVWNVDPSPGVFNLSQLWLLGQTNAGVIQTIESGWQKYPSQTGSLPVLFVYYNPNGYNPQTSGYLSNQSHLGFIQQPGSDWLIGGAMPQPYSSAGGDQHGNQMQWQIDDKQNWWLFFGTGDQPPSPLGYFPSNLYQNGTLAQSAQQLQFGGEVCSRGPGEPTYPTTGAMGSGLRPFATTADSFRKVAFQKQLSVLLSVGGKMTHANLQVQAGNQDPGYTATQVSNSGSPAWGSFMFFGGSQSS